VNLLWFKKNDGIAMYTDHFFISDPTPSCVSCSNRECHGGGHDLTEIISPPYHAKDRSKVQEKEGSVGCKSYGKIGVEHGHVL
jgi:hypothetical protein